MSLTLAVGPGLRKASSVSTVVTRREEFPHFPYFECDSCWSTHSAVSISAQRVLTQEQTGLDAGLHSDPETKIVATDFKGKAALLLLDLLLNLLCGLLKNMWDRETAHFSGKEERVGGRKVRKSKRNIG